jgi:hypothetical protein
MVVVRIINARDGGAVLGLASTIRPRGLGGTLRALRMGSLPVGYLLHVKHCRRSARGAQRTRPPFHATGR